MKTKDKKNGGPVEIPDDREQNETNLKADLKTVLKKKNKTVMVTFKDMTLKVMASEEGKPVKILINEKYKLGDIGKMRYATQVKNYFRDGYEILEEKSNFAELLKNSKKNSAV